MNYYTALQRGMDKRWDYTRRNDGVIQAIGYCRGWSEETSEALIKEYGEDRGEMFYRAQEERRANQSCYHDDGHETKEKAQECYKLYLLDNRLQLDGTMSGQKRQCEFDGCDVWTQKFAEVSASRMFVLCDEHRTREVVSGLFEVGDSMGSY